MGQEILAAGQGDPARGWRGRRDANSGGFDGAFENWVVGRARASPLGVRRERAIDAMAAGATVLESQRERAAAAAPSGLAPAAGEKPSEARQHRLGRACCHLPPREALHPGLARSARGRRPRGRCLPAQGPDRRRAGCALGRVGTPTSWGRSAAGQARGRKRATRSRSSWPRRRCRASAAHPRCAYSPSEDSPAPAARLGRASRPQAADDLACDGGFFDVPQAVLGASGEASAG